MRLATVLGPTAEPISLKRAKAHLRVDGDLEDSIIAAKLAAALQYVEGYIGRRLVRQTLDGKLDGFPAIISFPTGPIREVSSITYLDSAGNSQTLAAANYQVDLERRLIAAAPTTPWPSTELGRIGSVTVRFVAGYAVPFTTDFASDANQLDMVAHPFADGDVVQVWNSGGELPDGLSASVNYYVVNSLTDSIELSLSSGGAAVTLTADGAATHFAGLVPEPILAATLLLLGQMYEHREQDLIGAVSSLGFGFDRLLSPYILPRFP